MSSIEIKIGADPELFCMKGDKYISAHTLLPGSKHEPFFVDQGAVQVDGVAAEFNIDPATTSREFVSRLRHVVSQMEKMIQEVDPDVRLVATPTATFDEDYFFNLPPEVLMLGCEPDFDAKTGEMNPKPFTTEPFRTGSFHIHIGWTSGEDTSEETRHFEVCRAVVNALDETLYPESLKWDSDTKRRELYGKEGSFRPKHYGVEYRPLSNKALSLPDNALRGIFGVVKAVAHDVLKKEGF